jgi:mannose-6-phosphate isomerase-like protein (cupin superfamily)
MPYRRIPRNRQGARENATAPTPAPQIMFHCPMAKAHTRRDFLSAASLAAAVALPHGATLLHASTLTASEQPADTGPHTSFKLLTGLAIESLVKDLQAAPGSKDIVSATDQALSITVTVEKKKTATEFEFHEFRDHVFQVIEGTTRYELGGSPRNSRQTKPGEWLAPDSEACTSIALRRGDILTIPRMTPHRRITETRVTLLLISATTR